MVFSFFLPETSRPPAQDGHPDVGGDHRQRRHELGHALYHRLWRRLLWRLERPEERLCRGTVQRLYHAEHLSGQSLTMARHVGSSPY